MTKTSLERKTVFAASVNINLHYGKNTDLELIICILFWHLPASWVLPVGCICHWLVFTLTLAIPNFAVIWFCVPSSTTNDLLLLLLLCYCCCCCCWWCRCCCSCCCWCCCWCRRLHSASLVHSESVLIPYTREILIVWSQTEKQKKTNTKLILIIAKTSIKQVKCQRAGYESTTTQGTPADRMNRQ